MNSKDDGTIRTNKPTRPIFGEPRKFDKPTRPVYFLEPVEFKKSGFAKRGQNPRVLSFKFVPRFLGSTNWVFRGTDLKTPSSPSSPSRYHSFSTWLPLYHHSSCKIKIIKIIMAPAETKLQLLREDDQAAHTREFRQPVSQPPVDLSKSRTGVTPCMAQGKTLLGRVLIAILGDPNRVRAGSAERTRLGDGGGSSY
jgi:hypothetical protein